MNHKLIAERCRAGGLSVHEAAMRARIDPDPIFCLPESPQEDGRIPFGVLRMLSQLLDIDLEDLVDPPPDAPCVEPGDDIRVEAALASFPTGVARDDLARCFGWPLGRVESAIAALEARLRQSGRRLKRIGWHRYTLGPNLAILSPGERGRLSRTVPRACERVDDQLAATVLRYIIGGWDRSGTYRDAPEALRDLVDRYLIEQRGGRLEPTPDVVFSLRLDDFDEY